jgi:hypothetical protein
VILDASVMCEHMGNQYAAFAAGGNSILALRVRDEVVACSRPD